MTKIGKQLVVTAVSLYSTVFGFSTTSNHRHCSLDLLAEQTSFLNHRQHNRLYHRAGETIGQIHAPPEIVCIKKAQRLRTGDNHHTDLLSNLHYLEDSGGVLPQSQLQQTRANDKAFIRRNGRLTVTNPNRIHPSMLTCRVRMLASLACNNSSWE